MEAQGAVEAGRAGPTRNKAATVATADAGMPQHHVPGKVVTFRVEQWRKWAANALMAQPERNQRVLAALVLAGDTRAVARDRFADVATKVAGFKKAGSESLPLRKTLEQADRFREDLLALCSFRGIDDEWQLCQGAEQCGPAFGIEVAHPP